MNPPNGINCSRWLAGGTVAGVLVNASGICLAHFILGQEYMDRFVAYLRREPDAAMMAQHLAVRLGLGIVAMFLYVAMRPHVGAGPGTALIAAAVGYLASSVPLALTRISGDALTGWRLAVAAPRGLAEIAQATLAGAWFYR
jgi:hypothetical protein